MSNKRPFVFFCHIKIYFSSPRQVKSITHSMHSADLIFFYLKTLTVAIVATKTAAFLFKEKRFTFSYTRYLQNHALVLYKYMFYYICKALLGIFTVLLARADIK